MDEFLKKHDTTPETMEPLEIKPKKRFWKMLLVYLLLFLGFIALFVRLFNLQVLNNAKYRELARHQHESRVQLKAERGIIYDRNGLLLASNVHSISLAVDPTMLKDDKDRNKLAYSLEQALGIPADQTLTKIKNAKGSFVWLIRSLLPGEASRLDSLNLKAFLKIDEPKRNYLYSSTAAQLIGCTDIDNHGLTGIELSLDTILKGKSGFMIMNRDALGRLMPSADLPKIPALHGRTVRLTIDINFQKIAEYELMQGVKRTGSASGTLIAIEPTTGEILAMATYPSFNPNNIRSLSQGSMLNKAINEAYEPGSTFKLITAAAALEEGIVSPASVLDGYNGLLKLNDISIRDDHPLGKVTFAEALAKSSNIIFSNVANNLQAPVFYKYIRDFGFGVPTGIELPGEASGNIKKPQDYDPTSKRFFGFGYGVTVTPIQLACAFAAVANRGNLMKPHIIKEISDEKGNKIYSSNPQVIRNVISEATTESLTDMLVGVVENGTGISAKIDGLKIAGKTGTTQQYLSGIYSKSSYTASFAGFFPADDPKIVMLIILDKPSGDYYGGSTAAPIFSAIAKSWIALHPEILSNEDPKKNEKDRFIPDITGLYYSEACQILSQFNLKPQNTLNPYDIIKLQEPKGNTYTDNKPAIRLTSITKAKNQQEMLKLNVTGLNLRRAISILHLNGIGVRIFGSGKVTGQSWITDSTGRKICILKCG